MRTCLACLALLMLAACGSSPTVSHYIITSLASTDAGITRQAGPLVGIERIRMPEYLDTLPIVRRDSDNRLIMDDTQRWAEPLSDALPRVLANNLGSLLPQDRFVTQPWSQNQQPPTRLTVVIEQLEAQGDAVVLGAHWQVSGDRSAARRGVFRADLASHTPDAIANAHSAVLADLARAIAEDLVPASQP